MIKKLQGSLIFEPDTYDKEYFGNLFNNNIHSLAVHLYKISDCCTFFGIVPIGMCKIENQHGPQ